MTFLHIDSQAFWKICYSSNMNMDEKEQKKIPIEYGKRVYTEETGGAKQSWFNYLVAKITLDIVCGWFHILFLLFVFSFYSKIVLSIFV